MIRGVAVLYAPGGSATPATPIRTRFSFLMCARVRERPLSRRRALQGWFVERRVSFRGEHVALTSSRDEDLWTRAARSVALPVLVQCG